MKDMLSPSDPPATEPIELFGGPRDGDVIFLVCGCTTFWAVHTTSKMRHLYERTAHRHFDFVLTEVIA